MSKVLCIPWHIFGAYPQFLSAFVFTLPRHKLFYGTHCAVMINLPQFAITRRAGGRGGDEEGEGVVVTAYCIIYLMSRPQFQTLPSSIPCTFIKGKFHLNLVVAQIVAVVVVGGRLVVEWLKLDLALITRSKWDDC